MSSSIQSDGIFALSYEDSQSISSAEDHKGESTVVGSSEPPLVVVGESPASSSLDRTRSAGERALSMIPSCSAAPSCSRDLPSRSFTVISLFAWASRLMVPSRPLTDKLSLLDLAEIIDEKVGTLCEKMVEISKIKVAIRERTDSYLCIMQEIHAFGDKIDMSLCDKDLALLSLEDQAGPLQDQLMIRRQELIALTNQARKISGSSLESPKRGQNKLKLSEIHRQIQPLLEEIASLEKCLDALEVQSFSLLEDWYPGISQQKPVLSSLTGQVQFLNDEIQREADEIEAWMLQLRRSSEDCYKNKINHAAVRFLDIGMWPPRSGTLFSLFRQDVAQSMLTQALERYDPQFVGVESSGGVYRIFWDVVQCAPDGMISRVKREIGCFKPDDEAPGGRYERTPSQGEVPGLDADTASIRQALISQLGTDTTTDSILATAAHTQFKYFKGEARIFEGGAWQSISPEEFTRRNLEEAGHVGFEGFPALKLGIFMEWIHEAVSMNERDYSEDKMAVYQLLQAKIIHGCIDDSFEDRVFEDVAFLNWDPNVGNQLFTPSFVGRIGKSLTWRQVDMDKGIPKGFIAGASLPRWGRGDGPSDRPLSPHFEMHAQAHYERIEETIDKCEQFWNQAIQQKIKMVEKSSLMKEEKHVLITRLKSKFWTKAHGNTLRAAAVVMWVAADLRKTPRQLFNVLQNTRVGSGNLSDPYEPKNLTQFADFYAVPSGKVGELVAELHNYNRTDNPDLLDIPSRLACAYLEAKARALNESEAFFQTPRKRERKIAKKTMQFMAEALQNPTWWE